MSDTIYRQVAIDGIKKEILERDGQFYKGLLVANHVIVHLPPAQPERKKGQNDQPESAKEYCAECDHIEMCGWYPYEGCEFRSIPQPQRKKGKWLVDEDGNMECPFCGNTCGFGNYCNECGADLRGERNEID